MTGEIKGIYKDTGTCSGLYVSDDTVSLIYKEIYGCQEAEGRRKDL